jgi:acetoin utilization deacetylase AcuC-like enzyme
LRRLGGLSWGEPEMVGEEALLRAHAPELLARLNQPQDQDDDTHAYPNIADFARRSVGGTFAAMRAAFDSGGFSVMRPPGHHATRTQAMGYCYLNQVAIAVLEARARGIQRIAVLDFDAHHANGTEDILLNMPGIALASVHQWPDYPPGTGGTDCGNNCFNFPVAPRSPREESLKKLAAAIEKLKSFRPDLLAVSAGFDAYRADPLSRQQLEVEDYHWLGQSIRQWGIPAFSVLEGGYSLDLPRLVEAYVRGLTG